MNITHIVLFFQKKMKMDIEEDDDDEEDDEDDEYVLGFKVL